MLTKLIYFATGLLSATLGFADTVTFIDTDGEKAPSIRSLNGESAMSGETVTLVARFSSGKTNYKIPINRVASIEFNLVYFNPGAPPQASALAEGPKALPTAKQPLVANAVELRNNRGTLEPCKVVGFDEEAVRCEVKGSRKPKEYLRALVLRVVVRGNP